METKLNVNISGAISEFQAAMKEFLLKRRLYRILLRGKGLEFEAYRNYAPDDDASSIDWKASKRANTLLVKQYRDERNLKVVFLIDLSENMVFGSAEKLKCEYAAEVVAAFAHLITTTGDKPGFVFFNESVKDYMKPSAGTKHFSRFVDYITTASNYRGHSNLREGFDFLLSYIGKSVESVILVSDFISFNEELKKEISLIANKFETTLLMIRDPLDNTLPDFAGEVVIEDPRTGQQLLMNPKVAKKAYELHAQEQEQAIRITCMKNNIDLLELMTNNPFVPTLSAFLKGRIKHKPRTVK
ncbi:MAG: DUF58 domain-containing protein [Nanoarchaeota archaeon]|nr:DUF58 domain-containing protein [Nanoarchaeota archaeon]MBU1051045.1 DUF58 domain-containing protein [Nanoarchaeota archaeon]MBU1989033.1 DUF58 domain-containing protein [Nanoarchaeota archaeon]